MDRRMVIDLSSGDSPLGSEIARSLAAFSEVQKQIAESMEPLRKVWEEQQTRWAALQEIWAKQSEEIAEGMKWFKTALEKAESVGRYGWFIPDDATPGQIVDIIDSITDETSANTAYLSYFTSFDGYHLNTLVKKTLKDPHLAPWNPLLKEALFCLRKKKYRVCIASLLPILDGLCASQFSLPYFYSKNTRRAFLDDRRQWVANNEVIMRYQWMAFIGFFETLFSHYDFANPPTTPPLVLNRHLLLHGRDIPQAKLEDCLRLLLALDAISNLAQWP
jgi:hypothetical protein